MQRCELSKFLTQSGGARCRKHYFLSTHTQFFSSSFKAICMPAAPPPRRHLYYCRGNSRFAPTVFLQRSSFSLRLRRNNRSSQITTIGDFGLTKRETSRVSVANDDSVGEASVLFEMRDIKDQSGTAEVLTELERDGCTCERKENLLGGFLRFTPRTC